jgi:type I restriction enzyme, R subunit
MEWGLVADESEAFNRKRRIDPRLKGANWDIAKFTSEAAAQQLKATAVEEYPTASGPADYALADGGSIRGVVEAKKLTVGPKGVLSQAERYSKGIAQLPKYQGQFAVPFVYSTNGTIIRFHDARHKLNLSREISGFHTPDALSEMLSRDLDASLAKLCDIPLPTLLRDYQRDANLAIEQAIADRHRKMLVTMATGTGKTLTMVSEVYRLMKSGVALRVLFLVDRRALAAQAVQAFAAFEAAPNLKFNKIYEIYSQRFRPSDMGEDEKYDPKVIPTSLLTKPKQGDAFVYVSTIQRMSINLFGKGAALRGEDEEEGDDTGKLGIPIHAFDLIIADECHRGYSSKELSVWRDTLNYFDAIRIGLTATPAAHTLAEFERVVYRYEYERAVREGHLVDYDPVRISSGVRINGVFLKEGDQVDNVDPETGSRELDVLEDERDYPAADIERKVTVPESNRKILAELKKYADEHEQHYGRCPKTLIFADNDLPHVSHADQLVEAARTIFGRGEGFVTKITGKVDRPLQRIREFRNRPNPGIAVSVDLMSTGVDIPDLEFIVLLRPIQSRILFEQMLGRGTRKSDNYPDKSHFVVFDCFDGTLLEYFRTATSMTIEPPVPPTRTNQQIVEDIWRNKDRDYNVRCLIKRLRRIDREMSGEATELFSRFIPGGDVGKFAEDLPSLIKNSFAATMAILRDADFQQLLTDYPRPARDDFVVAVTATDTVESERLIRAGASKEYKPEDYLTAFSAFVSEHADDIEALSILLKRPAEWSPTTLSQLREALVTAPEHFTSENLERAYHVARRKDLVDIISMVKNAAAATSPLLTAGERVDAAIQRVTDGKDLTGDQQQWLTYIRNHLVANLSIDRDDFDLVPVLSDRGGWGRANRVFDGELDDLIADLNREIAA